MEIGRTGERVAALAVAGIVAFHQPLLGVFDTGAKYMVGGVPMLYVYLFVAWTALIALLALILERAELMSEADGSEGEINRPSGLDGQAGGG